MSQQHTAEMRARGRPAQIAQASALITEARLLISRDSRRTRDLAVEALSLLASLPPRRTHRALALAAAMLLVKALYQIGDLAGALEVGQKALARARGGRASDDLYALISRLTWVYADSGLFERAIELNRRAFRMAHQSRRHDWEALAHSDMAVIYDRWGKQEECREATLRITMPDLIGALQGEEKALVCYNIAVTYTELGQPARALTYVEEGLASARTSHLLARRGALLAELGDEVGAEESMREAYALACAMGDFYDEFNSLLELATLVRRQGRLNEAISILQQAMEAVTSAPTLQLHCLKQLAEIYAEQGGFHAAYSIMRRMDTIREAAYSEQVNRQARALEVEFRAEIARRETEIERKKNAELQRSIAELQRLQAELHELSVRDPLTGLFNRRYLMAQLEVFLNQAARRSEPICVAIFDIDHFKEINDRFSHQIGDRVLQQIASIAQAQVRACDVLARYGGEEFVVILTNTCLAAGVIVCERLRHAIASYTWGTIHAGVQVTASIGLASSADLENPLAIDPLLRSADDKMYAAKAEGRNQIRY